MEFIINDFSPSDGIRECENIIKQAGGTLRSCTITIKRSQLSLFVSSAANYLCNEWDYAVEEIIEDVPDRV